MTAKESGDFVFYSRFLILSFLCSLLHNSLRLDIYNDCNVGCKFCLCRYDQMLG